jgi:hypothetical protein
MLTVVGFPRSGTNFLTRMLAHYIDGPDVEVWPGTPAHPKVNKIHWAYQDDGTRPLVYIYRDPRDVVLSGWEYIKHHYDSDLELMRFLEYYFVGRWMLWPTGWREHTRYWLAQDVPSLHYELLCAKRKEVLRWLVDMKLSLDLDESRIAHAVAQSYNFGERHDGRWKSELPLWTGGFIDEYCGDLMRELGYA